MRSAVEQSHAFLRPVLHAQAVCIDATLGTGRDTAFFLACGARKVYAYEIQEDVFQTTMRQFDQRVIGRCHSHEYIDEIEEPVDAVIFNFGYCPGHDPAIMTQPETSRIAVRKAADRLRLKGRMALVFYPHPQGRAEAETIETMLHTWPLDQFQIVKVRSFHPDAPYWIGIEKRR
ncbi:tRNA (mnm(5)s(2)U34)-methyltransferase [Catenisphaera adipataccumulans]|uniref:rRNA methylase n=1 Tax=Catenisphaera adipataccumulans TaxID=700500 RepID=A0A7W8CVY2_9FIRM|nr:class I SAM-dependent methyltransferase [Catenisphaera adipataccumulans]MBB5182578.1 hypothetical protein [Catenisphaera adipataccumulans]